MVFYYVSGMEGLNLVKNLKTGSSLGISIINAAKSPTLFYTVKISNQQVNEDWRVFKFRWEVIVLSIYS